jgi:hypothetical protein
MSAVHRHPRNALVGFARLLRIALMLSTPVVLPIVGAAMLFYGWTTP